MTHNFRNNKLLFLLTCFIIHACVNDDPDPFHDGDCFHLPDDTVVFTSFKEDSLYLNLYTEDIREVKIPLECITDYSFERYTWQINLTYADGLKKSYPYLCDTFNLSIDTVIVNPGSLAPPTALISFRTPLTRSVAIKVKGKTDKSAEIGNVFETAATEHEIPVFGLYSNYNNQVELHILDARGKSILSREISIHIGPYERVQSGEMAVISNQLDTLQKNRLFLIQNAIYDAAGDVRWYTTHQGQKFFRLENNLVGIQVYPYPVREWVFTGADLVIIDLFGNIVDSFNVPNRLHHEINEKSPGGNLLVASNSGEYNGISDDTEDLVVEIDRHSGTIIKQWNLAEIFDSLRPRIWTEGENDWCHLNSIEYDPSDNSLIVSSKLQCFVSKIDYETGSIKWILGNHNNWGTEWEDYLLDPLNFDTAVYRDLDWTYVQHMPRITGTGTIMVYDNGKRRPGGDYSRIIEYFVNESVRSVEKTWEFIIGEGTSTMGSVHLFDDQTIQIGHGEDGVVLIVDRDKNILFKGELKTFYRSYDIQFY